MDYENKAEDDHYSSINGMAFIVSQAVSGFDVWTDACLANQMYWMSMSNKGKLGNYKLAFIWIFMCISGPYIIQYSSLMSSFFLKGYFTKINW